MTAMNPPDRAYEALSDKELEVLHLLAAGHTVKSIAAQLGRSEASINERLRDARRKTRIGSSRELARLIAGQKIWDKNTDLSLLVPDGAGHEQPPVTGRSWPKGTLMMLIALPLAAAGLMLAAPAALNQADPAPASQAAAMAASPLVGTWSLDVAKIPAEERPREVTIEFGTTADGKWATHVRIIAPDGAVMEARATAAADGVTVPIAGNMGFIDSASLRQPAPDTLVMTLSKRGVPVSTRVYTASKDRRTMTETIVWAGPDVPKLETTYFNRVK